MWLKPISCWLSVRKTTYINQGGPDFLCEAVAILCGDPHFRQCLRVPVCPVILNLPREDPNLPTSQFLANNILIWISYWFCFSGWTLAATLLFVLPSFCLSFPSVKTETTTIVSTSQGWPEDNASRAELWYWAQSEVPISTKYQRPHNSLLLMNQSMSFRKEFIH